MTKVGGRLDCEGPFLMTAVDWTIGPIPCSFDLHLHFSAEPEKGHAWLVECDDLDLMALTIQDRFENGRKRPSWIENQNKGVLGYFSIHWYFPLVDKRQEAFYAYSIRYGVQ